MCMSHSRVLLHDVVLIHIERTVCVSPKCNCNWNVVTNLIILLHYDIPTKYHVDVAQFGIEIEGNVMHNTARISEKVQIDA